MQIGAVGERDELADAVDGDGRQPGGLGFGEGVIEGQTLPLLFFRVSRQSNQSEWAVKSRDFFLDFF